MGQRIQQRCPFDHGALRCNGCAARRSGTG
jgi:hypothetical protein